MNEPLTKEKALNPNNHPCFKYYGDFKGDDVLSALQGLKGDLDDYAKYGYSIGKSMYRKPFIDVWIMLVDKWFPIASDSSVNKGEQRVTVVPDSQDTGSTLPNTEGHELGGSEIDEQTILYLKDIDMLFSRIWYGISDSKRLEFKGEAQQISNLLLVISQRSSSLRGVGDVLTVRDSPTLNSQPSKPSEEESPAETLPISNSVKSEGAEQRGVLAGELSTIKPIPGFSPNVKDAPRKGKYSFDEVYAAMQQAAKNKGKE